MGNFKLQLESGLNFFHASSAFQKCVRRGMQHESLWFGTELFISGYEEYAWFRMLVMASEDVGLADPQTAVQINSLYETYKILKKKKNKHGPERLPFVNAILILVRSKKSRMVDNLLCEYMFLRNTVEQPELPDFIFDMHTREGKKMGRGNEFFYEESALINNVPEWIYKEEFEVRDRVKAKYLEEEA